MGRKRRIFYWVRVSLLLGVFLAVAGWAAWDIRERRARNAWRNPLNVGLVVLRSGPVSDDTVMALRGRIKDLQDHLNAEFQRWRGSNEAPFEISLYGPLDITTPPPASYSNKLLDLAYFAYQQWRYLRQVDKGAGVPRFRLDSRVYLVVRPPNPGDLQFVEGQSQQGGRVGMVGVQLDPSMVDLALFVATHELFHTLGATDKYDELGHTRLPDGLAEPELVPQFPQRYVEVMARNRPITPELEEPPNRIDQLRVGRLTAREIGWIE